MLQGSNNIFSSSHSSTDAPAGLLAAVAVAWLTVTRLMGWSGSSALNAAASHVQHAYSVTCAADRAAGVLLLPVLSVLQHLHYSDQQHVFLPLGVAAAPTSSRSKLPAAAAAGSELTAARQLADGLMVEGLLQGCRAAAGAAVDEDATTGQMAALISTAQLLQLLSTSLTAGSVAEALQETALHVMQLCPADRQHTPQVAAGTSTNATVLEALGPFCARHLAEPRQDSTSTTSGATVCSSHELPQLRQLCPVLAPALGASGQPQLQAAALQLLTSYLQSAQTARMLEGTQQLLLDALNLLTSSDSSVRDAALALTQQYLQPVVLEAAFAGQQRAEDAATAATQVAAEGQEAAVVLASRPQRMLLQHLQELLTRCSGSNSGSAVAAKTAVMRAVAGLFEGLVGCQDLPLLQLLQQVTDDNAQVRLVVIATNVLLSCCMLTIHLHSVQVGFCHTCWCVTR